MKIYDQLKQQPLFGGMGSDDLGDVVAHVRFGFETAARKAVIASPKMPCKRLLMLTEGVMTVETRMSNGVLMLTETIEAPVAIEPERLFGLQQHYLRTYQALTKCSIITVDKNDMLKIFATSLVFKINVLNYLCAITQRKTQLMWDNAPANLQERIVRYLKALCLTPAGTKVFHVKMTDMAKIMGCTRLEVSIALNDLGKNGCILLKRGIIILTD